MKIITHPLIKDDLIKIVEGKITDREIYNIMAEDRVKYNLGGKVIVRKTKEKMARNEEECIELRKILNKIRR